MFHCANVRPMKKKKLVLSDVDGTIVRGSLVLNHACVLAEAGVIGGLEIALAWKADPKNEDLITALAEHYRAGVVGMTVEDLKVDEFIDSILADKGNFYSTMDRLLQFKDEGYDVILVSGSPTYLVKALASHFGFYGVGSSYLTDDAGRFTGECVGMFSASMKREYVSGLNLAQNSEIIAFGDTASDVALFEVASHSVLVEPSEITMTAIGEKVNEVVVL